MKYYHVNILTYLLNLLSNDDAELHLTTSVERAANIRLKKSLLRDILKCYRSCSITPMRSHKWQCVTA